jgi:hypothetical protein
MPSDSGKALGVGAAVLGGPAGAMAAGPLLGAMGQESAINHASEMQNSAAQYSIDQQKQQYDRFRNDQQPWMDAGTKALSDMANPDFQRDFTAADFQKDPGYDFRLQEGQKALERSAAARGGLQSGGTMKAVSRYGQNFASNEYGNAYNRFNNDRSLRFNRLSSIAGMGQNATTQVGNMGMHYADGVGNISMSNANAQAAAAMGKSAAWNGAMNQYANMGTQAASMAMGMPGGLGGMGGGGGGMGRVDGVAMNGQDPRMSQLA